MKRFEPVIMWLALVLIIALIVLSTYGAFIGAEKAKEFFNSIPLQAFWFVLLLVLIAAVILFPRLLNNRPVAMIHFGIILILAGSVWSSNSGHALQRRIFGNHKFASGKMLIRQGQTTNKVVVGEHMHIAELPFHIALKNFDVQYYDKPEGAGGFAMPKEYVSNVTVKKDNKTVAAKKIKVNHPLYYGGYYFYQYDYDKEAGSYTILKVASDSGLTLVFGGYLFLCAGFFWLLWFKRLRKTKVQWR